MTYTERKRKGSIHRTFLVIAVVVCMLEAHDAMPSPPEQDRLIVGTKATAPFVLKDTDGSWSGISVDLWNVIAEELGLEFEFRETDLAGLISGLENGSLDVSIAALTITSERERVIDFTHPFYTTGLGIAVLEKAKRGWMGVLERFLSVDFLEIVLLLVFLLLVIGMLVWWFERRKNPEQFGGGALRGIGSGFWWSAVTMTTVGYGDKAPKTIMGRFLGIVWMFTAIITVSGFTAAITTTLTVSQIESAVNGLQNLHRVRVATVQGSTSDHYLSEQRIAHSYSETPLEGLRALAAGTIDAFVYDAPILRYLAGSELERGIQILPVTLLRQDYGFGLPQGSTLREPINYVLVETIQGPRWEDILSRYLGD